MASESRWKGGRLGPFHLGRRYKDKDVGGDLGRIYEAHNVETGAAALVLMPGKRAGWEPEESWRVRAFAQVTPPYVALEVEQAPPTGKLPELADMLDLLTSAVERLEKQVGARTHLTHAPVGFMKRWTGRLRRMLRSRGAVVLGLLLAMSITGLGVTLWVGSPDPDHERVPMMVSWDMHDSTGYLLWVALSNTPPCYEEQAEYQGKCYAPVSRRTSLPPATP